MVGLLSHMNEIIWPLTFRWLIHKFLNWILFRILHSRHPVKTANRNITFDYVYQLHFLNTSKFYQILIKNSKLSEIEFQILKNLKLFSIRKFPGGGIFESHLISQDSPSNNGQRLYFRSVVDVGRRRRSSASVVGLPIQIKAKNKYQIFEIPWIDGRLQS